MLAFDDSVLRPKNHIRDNRLAPAAKLSLFCAIIEAQSFERAAKVLRITQSAVSQRIAALEAYYGQRLLVRELPYHASELGERLLSHLRQVTALESELQTKNHERELLASVRVAANRDSLDLWMRSIFYNSSIKDTLLEYITNDQELTLEYLRSGQVDIAISAEGKSIPRCESTFLIEMPYMMVCTPEFKKRFFAKGFLKSSLHAVPAVLFDERDKAHAQYLMQRFNYEMSVPHSWCPSTKAFKEAIVAGYGYGLMPLLDIKTELNKGKVVRLDPKENFSIKLYLHNWQIVSKRISLVKMPLLKRHELVVNKVGDATLRVE